MRNVDDWNEPAFRAAQASLQALGWEVTVPHDDSEELFDKGQYSPFEVDMKDPKYLRLWRKLLAKDCAALADSDAAGFIDNWRLSDGALLEMDIARAFKLEMYLVKDNVPILYPCDDQTLALIRLCGHTMTDIIGANSAAHGGHVEWTSRSPTYHMQKVVKHGIQAIAQLDWHEPVKDREGAVEHIERSLVRSAMALFRKNSLT